MALQPPPCYLLDNFPPELRNRIYELVFTFKHIQEDEDGLIDVCDAVNKLPNALIFTCKTIHAEASKMYAARLRRFWAKNDFVATQLEDYHEGGPTKPDLKAIQNLTDKDICQMRSFEFEHGTVSFRLLSNRGGWDYGLHIAGGDFGTEGRLRPQYLYSKLGYRYIGCKWFDSEEELFKACDENEMEVPLLHQLCWLIFDIGGHQDQFGGPAD